MPPEREPSQDMPEATIQETEWDGPWGSISPVPQSVEILSIQIDDEPEKTRIYYYPYRTIGKWNWTMDTPETLEILIGGVQLMISGSGLRRLAEALCLGQLRLVHVNQSSNLVGGICIQAIALEDLKG